MNAKQIFLKVAFDCWRLELPNYRNVENYLQNVILAIVFNTEPEAQKKVYFACHNLGLSSLQTAQVVEILNTALAGMNADAKFQKELLDNPALARMELCQN